MELPAGASLNIEGGDMHISTTTVYLFRPQYYSPTKIIVVYEIHAKRSLFPAHTLTTPFLNCRSILLFLLILIRMQTPVRSPSSSSPILLLYDPSLSYSSRICSSYPLNITLIVLLLPPLPSGAKLIEKCSPNASPHHPQLLPIY